MLLDLSADGVTRAVQKPILDKGNAPSIIQNLFGQKIDTKKEELTQAAIDTNKAKFTGGWQKSTTQMVLPEWAKTSLPPAPTGYTYGWGTDTAAPKLIPDPTNIYTSTSQRHEEVAPYTPPKTSAEVVSDISKKIEGEKPLIQKAWFFPAVGVAGLVILFIFMSRNKSQSQAVTV